MKLSLESPLSLLQLLASRGPNHSPPKELMWKHELVIIFINLFSVLSINRDMEFNG